MKKVKTFLKDSFLGYIVMILLLFVPPFVSGYYLGTADGYFNITLTIILLLVSVIIDIAVLVCFFGVPRHKVVVVDEWLSGDIKEDAIGVIEQGASTKFNDYLIITRCGEKGENMI